VQPFGVGSAPERAGEIYGPEEDPGEWAPGSLAILNMETGHLGPMSYWATNGLDECFRLSDAAGVGFIEYVNAAVAAVYR